MLDETNDPQPTDPPTPLVAVAPRARETERAPTESSERQASDPPTTQEVAAARVHTEASQGLADN